ncbi:methyl-accepting chemotaxis protein [Fundidesulfovibrio soli]|uniref:methyl-accepting chemotaxis protein n=1 Tax=Fundidesulfovibrio soli TaxID=2922716 RepID=UPI001FAF06E8|nr:methyl-accepting chemotaxis protein [Fundidesulfovibrio soli]
MGIRGKMFLPFVAVVIILGGVSLWTLDSSLSALEKRFVMRIVAGKAAEVENAIENVSRMTLEQAAMFSRIPSVIAAYEEALSGNINDEADPAAQNARQRIRKELADVGAGYSEVLGGRKLMLHYHLPNARSLVRLWRDKQVTRNGQKLDVSDDISAFRPTVKDVNATGKPVMGVELGEGGFVIRGVAPVKTAQNKQLGSVELLAEFGPILEGAASEGQELLLYMNAQFLNITAALRDPAKNPVLDGKFVRVSGAKDAGLEKLVTPELLARGQKELVVERKGDLSLGAFPIKDYKGVQTGVMVAVVNTASESATISTAKYTLAALLALLLIVPTGIASIAFMRSVARPIDRIVAKIRDITEDKADLTDRLPEDSRDEMASLAIWFNKLMVKVSQLISINRSVLDAVPDPLFVVDEEYRIKFANKATSEFAGIDQRALAGMSCSDIFKTKACNTPDCPIQRERDNTRGDGAARIECIKEGRRVVLRPFVKTITDDHGTLLGYLELAQDVTGMVEREEALEEHLEQLRHVNAEITAVAEEISGSLEEISAQVEEVSQGADIQKSRVEETLSSMSEMTAASRDAARSAQEASTQAEATRETAEQGEKVVRQAREVIDSVRAQTELLRSNMDGLGRRAQDIGRILTVINDIADQTNLLALNAAIEAARAGDAGRGFAVVADEVRKLAEKTVHATGEVSEVIGAIQNETRNNLDVTVKAVETVDKATSLSELSGDSLKRIVELVHLTAEQVRTIATAAEEQSSVSEHIGKALDDVHAVSASTARGMDASAQALSGLAELAQRLRSVVAIKE